MKILVTGAKGQLGYDVIKRLQERKIDCLGTDIEQFDITNYVDTENYIKEYNPDAVIHCSAYTAVDKAEDEYELCYEVNVKGTENIAKVCKSIKAKMLYISTDYVFPGEGTLAYEVDAHKKPLSVYGKTKLLGEEMVKKHLNQYFIVRISWVFGKNGNNFVKTMLRLAEKHSEVRVVSDQVGSPTYTADLAPLLCDMIATENYGVYHATNEGYCSWAEFARTIYKEANLKVQVESILTKEYPTNAVRPSNSRLSKKSLDERNFNRLPAWEDALHRYLIELKIIKGKEEIK